MPEENVRRETAPVKKSPSHGSHRITPPEPIREAVDMERDEPWSWYYHDESETLFIRRSGATLSGIPDDVRSVGVAEARKNGRYLDFAIPTSAVEHVPMQKGQRWRFDVLDENTMRLRLTNDAD
jgi:hypothetical protein